MYEDKFTQQIPNRGAAPDPSILSIRRCGTCATVLAPMTLECSFCRSLDLEWVPSSGTGTIVSWRVTHRRSDAARGDVVPLVIAIVELDDGPWLYSTIEGEIAPDAERPRVQFKPQPPGGRFPVFAVCRDAA